MFKFRYAIIARILCKILPIERKNWIFGSDYGNMYREGSKYLIEYIMKYHPDFKCTFITKNHDVYQELKNKGIPCLMNDSLKAVFIISKAEAVFTTQWLTDIDYDFPRKGRHYYYLVHGQPLKLAHKALKNKLVKEGTNIPIPPSKIITKVYNFTIGKRIRNWKSFNNIDFVSATSKFLQYYMQLDFGKEMDVKILGMPRNDALFDNERMKKERWINGIEDKFVVTYMPTHRLYGRGALTPTPFINKPEYQKWMRDNDVILLMKQHPNMILQLKDIPQTDVIQDITVDRLDPQVCLYHSDVLVTDFSSVWMDYLLLKRPIIFYIYDNFESMDAGCHYDIREDPPGHFCYTEDEFFNLIRKAKKEYEKMKPSDRIIHKYHKYQDGNSCERYFNEIFKELGYK